MSLLKKIKTRLQESRVKGKQQKEERKIIDREASAQAQKEYMESYRKERINAAKTNARARAKRDASGTHTTLGTATSIGKAGFNMFGKAGRNLMESGAFDLPTSNVDLGLGTAKPQTKKGKKKKKTSNLFDIGF